MARQGPSEGVAKMRGARPATRRLYPREFQSESARVPASRVDPPYAQKAMQSRIMFPDKLLDMSPAQASFGPRETRLGATTVCFRG